MAISASPRALSLGPLASLPLLRSLRLLLPLAALGASCPRDAVRPVRALDEQGLRSEVPVPLAPRALDALLGGRVRIVGVDLPAEAAPGARVPVTLVFLVERSCVDTDLRVFIHGSAPGAELIQAAADHAPLQGRVTPVEWRAGDVLYDRFELVVPPAYALDTLVMWGGLFEGSGKEQMRWSVTPAAAHDGRDRVELGRVRILGGAPVDTVGDARRARGPVQIDGVLDEPDWRRAHRLGPFIAHDGMSPLSRATFARILWDEAHLYVAFEGADPDVFSPYSRDDDPLYESEAVEVFIDADGDRDVYVELQAAPANDLHFDAAFAGGRRKAMDRAWGAPYETKTTTTAAGFVSEWRIPVSALRDIPEGEPRVGAHWKINLFRLERVRVGTRVVQTEASAWSTPLSGDFHNLDRFATLRFVE